MIDGLLLVAHETSSREIYLYAGERQLRFVRQALEERRSAGFGELPVNLVESPTTFVSGEKSAVIGMIEGGEEPYLEIDSLTTLHLDFAGGRQ